MNGLKFRPKKSLGQNFLVDENIARKIIQCLAPTPNDVILEIGAGFGVLTKYLVSEVKQLVAVEIDNHLFEKLQLALGCHKNVTLIHDDILKIDLKGCFPEQVKIRVLGNIPYHITSPVLFEIFDFRHRVEDMILMVQKEVAQRLAAAPGNKEYGILSVFSQLFSDVRILFHVSKNVFKPQPEVDSSVVRWDFYRSPQLMVKDFKLLDKIIHRAFQQRRKMLRRSLRNLPEIAGKLNCLDFNLEQRPEELRAEEFVRLANLLSE
ncbi:MAG: 16S rRNA (adenine(1518)-N(6)/adenine(1519)-N(6))-dimethyltransferase RsmA [bacterium]